MFKRGVSLLASAGVIGAMLVLVPPAQAGSNWSKPQEVSARYGRKVEMSDNGRVAVWIRTNRLVDSVIGPVRSASFISAKKGWSRSVSIPGSAETTDLMLSSDGTYALIEMEQSGYAIAKRRSARKWATATPVVQGIRISDGQMSADARTVVWVDWADPDEPYPQPPGALKARMRPAGGTWGPEVTIGKVSNELQYKQSPAVALSRDGRTLVWLDENSALTSSTKAGDGTWSGAGLIKQYTAYVGLSQLQVSANGTRVMWVRDSIDGVLTASRSITGWSPVSYATVDETTTAVLSPNGKFVFWVTGVGDVQMSRRLTDRWARAKAVGSLFYGYTAMIAVTNKTAAYSSIGYRGGSPTCAVSASTLAGSTWTKGKKLARGVCYPAVSYNGKTIVWGSFGEETLQSVKR